MLGTDSWRGLILPPELSQTPPHASSRRDGGLTRYPLKASAAARRLVAATAGGAAVRTGAAEAWRAANAACHAPAFIFISTIAEAGHPAVVIILGTAPNTAAILSEHPHVEGGVAVELEVQGAPAAQATRAGKRLPARVRARLPAAKTSSEAHEARL